MKWDVNSCWEVPLKTIWGGRNTEFEEGGGKYASEWTRKIRQGGTYAWPAEGLDFIPEPHGPENAKVASFIYTPLWIWERYVWLWILEVVQIAPLPSQWKPWKQRASDQLYDHLMTSMSSKTERGVGLQRSESSVLQRWDKNLFWLKISAHLRVCFSLLSQQWHLFLLL